MSPHEITLFLYNMTLFPVIFFSLLFILLAFINIFFFSKPKKDRYPKQERMPFISVQIPTFNDPVAKRCIERCLQFDYPKDRFEIVIVDDSTNVETQLLLAEYAELHPGFVKYIHRENRQGFKPGALRNAMKITKGEIIVIFDADWIPGKQFLKRISKPFADPKVALVQTRQGIYNRDTNLITRFAAYTLMIYHSIIMPINNKINCVFFCGTAGALRRSAMDEVGGWNLNSITEDSDLSVNLLKRGYRTVYLDFETPSEVPETFESFVKQQMRWCYGNVRVFCDNAKSILFGKGFSIKQRMMITYILMSHAIAPIIVGMTLFGLSGWFVGEPTLITWGDMVEFIAKFLMTAGFIFIGAVMLYRYRLLKELKYLVATVFTIGPIMAFSSTIAFFRAIFNKGLHWFCTPKNDNVKALE